MAELNEELAKTLEEHIETIQLQYGLSSIAIVYCEPFQDGTTQIGSVIKGSWVECLGALDVVSSDLRLGEYLEDE